MHNEAGGTMTDTCAEALHALIEAAEMYQDYHDAKFYSDSDTKPTGLRSAIAKARASLQSATALNARAVAEKLEGWAEDLEDIATLDPLNRKELLLVKAKKMRAYAATLHAEAKVQECEYICKCGVRVVPHRCQTGGEF
jgi:hypothetical protein